jgi:hypothetical protein
MGLNAMLQQSAEHTAPPHHTRTLPCKVVINKLPCHRNARPTLSFSTACWPGITVPVLGVTSQTLGRDSPLVSMSNVNPVVDADLLLTGSVKQHWAYVNHLRLHSVPAQSQKVNDIPMAQLVLAGGAADQLTKLLNMLCSRLLTSLPSVCSRAPSEAAA